MTKNLPPLPPSRFVLCLLVAALFWFLNALNKGSYAVNVAYPVRFVYNDSLYVPTSVLPRTVQVNVSGTGWQLLRQSWLPLRAEPVEYVVRNPLRATVINTSALMTALADQVKSLKINYVLADTLEVNFDRRSSKIVRLVADSTHIDLAPRMVVTSRINLTPATITLEGPARVLRVFSDTLLVKIPGKQLMSNYDEELIISTFRHPQVRASTNRVMVSFEIAELLGE
jgi:hypothetical protein